MLVLILQMAFNPLAIPENLVVEEEPVVHGEPAVVVDLRSEDHNLQVMSGITVIPSFDIIFEARFGSNLNLNALNVIEEVLLPNQEVLIEESPHGGMIKFCVPKLTVDRFLYVMDWLTLVKTRWSLGWGWLGGDI